MEERGRLITERPLGQIGHCGECFECCTSHPGWFVPGEVENAALHLGMTPSDFVNQYCVIDWILLPNKEDEEKSTLVQVYVPARIDKNGVPLEPTGQQVSSLYPNRKGGMGCIFLNRDPDEGESPCKIYPSRPSECRQYHCGNQDWANPRHEDTARLWLEAAKPEQTGRAKRLKDVVDAVRLEKEEVPGEDPQPWVV